MNESTALAPNLGPTGFRTDPRLDAVDEETHRRPPVPAIVPGHCAHFAYRTDNIGDARHYDYIRDLLTRLDATVETDRPDQIVALTAALAIKWERHTEFCSMTFFTRDGGPAGDWLRLPEDWRAACPGLIVVALKIDFVGHDPDTDVEAIARNGSDRPAGIISVVNGGVAVVDAEYRAADGFTHLRVSSADTDPGRLGRLVQRLIEIETYRVLALYAWPDAQALGPLLGDIDRGLVAAAEQLGGPQQGSDQDLLGKLTGLAQQLEHVAAQTHFRLNASIAYYELVQRRLIDIRESKIEGAQRLSSFINRRLDPAARTYRAILVRQGEMAERVARASDLLRSRIDVELALQNQAVLRAMNERADQQYRLQLTVEGLSTVAISYYAIAILGYILTALSVVTSEFETKLWEGIAAPFVVVSVYFALRRLRAAHNPHKG
ncbi:MAG TPA: DUF3422 domain-containing protein [Arsenicitalea sp.]|jgi:uncharacterized membrane-anchored protein|nr:DUF3422 domain-containing protein [Arsenicitalea sp.]